MKRQNLNLALFFAGVLDNLFDSRRSFIIDPVSATLRTNRGGNLPDHNNAETKFGAKSGYTGLFRSATQRTLIWIIVIHVFSSEKESPKQHTRPTIIFSTFAAIDVCFFSIPCTIVAWKKIEEHELIYELKLALRTIYNMSAITTSQTPQATTARPAFSPGMARLLRVCLWLYIAYIVGVMGLAKPIAYPGIDYDKHWFAARAILEGKSVYFGGTLWMGFNYPQAAALAFFWLGFFSCAVAEYLWKATLLALCAGCWWMAWRYFRDPASITITITITSTSTSTSTKPNSTIAMVREGMARHWGLTTAFMTCTFFALTTCIYIGNIDAVNGFLAMGMVAACLSGAPVAAGVFWGLLTLVKMIPLLLIVPILFWRQWGLIKGFLIAMAVYFMVLLATGRVGQEWYFVREAIPMIPVWWRFLSMSPVAFVLRICGLRQYIENPHAFMLIVRCATAVLFIIYLAMLRSMVRRRMDWLRGLEAEMVFYPLFSPLLEYHHFVWIMPVFFLQARRWVRGELAPRSAVLLLIGWTLLNATYHLQDLLPKGKELIHFTGLPGYLIVLVVTLWDLLGKQKCSSPSVSEGQALHNKQLTANN